MKKQVLIVFIVSLFTIAEIYAQDWQTTGNSPAPGAILGTLNSENLNIFSGGASRMIIKSNGNIGIGTDKTNGFLLSVDGTMRAREIFVNLETWSDFVFDPGYDLMPLSELEIYILLHGKLPEIPSEEEVLEDGVEMGEMNRLLLQKVEELTLHIIDLNKRMKAM